MGLGARIEIKSPVSEASLLVLKDQGLPVREQHGRGPLLDDQIDLHAIGKFGQRDFLGGL